MDIKNKGVKRRVNVGLSFMMQPETGQINDNVVLCLLDLKISNCLIPKSPYQGGNTSLLFTAHFHSLQVGKKSVIADLRFSSLITVVSEVSGFLIYSPSISHVT